VVAGPFFCLCRRCTQPGTLPVVQSLAAITHHKVVSTASTVADLACQLVIVLGQVLIVCQFSKSGVLHRAHCVSTCLVRLYLPFFQECGLPADQVLPLGVLCDPFCASLRAAVGHQSPSQDAFRLMCAVCFLQGSRS
jgi:hypothetical protein